MKSLLQYIFIFLVILFTGDRLLSITFDKFIVSKSNFRYTKLYTRKAQADILLIGNSRGLSFYQPSIERITGYSTFNLSYNGLPTNLAIILLRDYLKLNGNPRLVIIELTMRSNKKELVTNFGCYSPYSKNLENLIKVESKDVYTFNNLFHLTRYNGEVFLRCLYYLNKPDTNWLVNTKISERSIQKQYTNKFEIGFDELAATDYKTIISICKSNNIPIKLIINPYLKNYRDRISDFPEFKEKLSRYLNEPIYDYSQRIDNTAVFADPMHLNTNGSNVLIEIMNTEGVFNLK